MCATKASRSRSVSNRKDPTVVCYPEFAQTEGLSSILHGSSQSFSRPQRVPFTPLSSTTPHLLLTLFGVRVKKGKFSLREGTSSWGAGSFFGAVTAEEKIQGLLGRAGREGIH